jgi:peptidoglycan/xylan/chitin deacetylase (PgdA/CDA1 family)
MTAAIQYCVRATDAAIARLYLALFREKNAVLSFLFHSLFRDSSQIALNLVDPLQRTTIGQFRQFIEYYLDHGYQFISPQNLLNGLKPEGKYALITFDDGYFNNALARPILEEYKVPAVFFISTNHVRENRCYWWDVLYRQRRAEGASEARIYREAIGMKHLRTEEIERRLGERFGPQAFVPRGDIDRPFTPAELRDFARSPFVHLGNHTANHAILTDYTLEEVRAQIHGAQEWLKEITGVRPVAIAYPNGAHDAKIVKICAELGLKVGFTVRPEKAPFDALPQNLLRLGRFATHGDGPIEQQCRTYRSDFSFYGKFRDGYLRFARGTVAQ